MVTRSKFAADWHSWPPEWKAELRWRLSARPNQLSPDGEWNVWLFLAGRGFGKTRLGAEWLRKKLLDASIRAAVVAPTHADARNVCMEGESGLLRCIPAPLVKSWNRSMGELKLANGSELQCFSAEQPERLRGPQHHFIWCDEMAAWLYPTPGPQETWDQLNFGLRLGQRPQAVVTTTPKPLPLIKELLERPDVVVTRGRTSDNAQNLAPAALAQLYARYQGTRLGRQELEAEIVEDVEGALWTHEMIEAAYLPLAPVTMKRVVVGVDPSGGKAETGIVVAGLGRDGRGYVLADVSGPGSPAEWGRRVVGAYREWLADRVAVETNFGGAMAEQTILAVDKTIPIKKLTASKGKIPRAEPIAALYEQGKVYHVGRFPKLEEQMTTYTPEDRVSPDRMDALVWALSELMQGGRRGDKMVAPVSLTRESHWRA